MSIIFVHKKNNNFSNIAIDKWKQQTEFKKFSDESIDYIVANHRIAIGFYQKSGCHIVWTIILDKHLMHETLPWLQEIRHLLKLACPKSKRVIIPIKINNIGTYQKLKVLPKCAVTLLNFPTAERAAMDVNILTYLQSLLDAKLLPKTLNSISAMIDLGIVVVLPL